MFFIFGNKRQTGYDINIAKLFSGPISHDASCEPGLHLEPSQIPTRECFCKIVNSYKPLTIFTKKVSCRSSLGSNYASVQIPLHLIFFQKNKAYRKQIKPFKLSPKEK